MRILKQKKAMLFYRKILSTVTVLLIAMLIIYSLVTYYTSERTILKIQNDSNIKILSQVNYNIDYFYGMVKNLTYYLYYDYTISPLLTENDIDQLSLDYINRMGKLNNISGISPFIESIILYNASNKKFISTGTDINLYNKPLRDELERYIIGEKSKFMEFSTINYLNEEKKEVSMFSFILRDWSQVTDSSKNVIIATIKPDWLFNNIKNINAIGYHSDSIIFIMDNNKKIHSNSKNAQIDNSIKNKIINSTDNVGFFKSISEGKKILVTYMKNSETDWCVISVQSYDVLFAEINKLRMTFITLTLLILIAATVLSNYFTRRLYKPLQEVFKHFCGAEKVQNYISTNEDELKHMTTVFDQAIQNLTSEQYKSFVNRRYVIQYFVRRLLSDSLSVTKKELQEIENDSELNINLKGKLMVVVLKIDDYLQFDDNNSNDRNLYNFAIQNISNEIFLKEFPCEIVNMRWDHFVLLFNVENEPLKQKSKINALIVEIQKVIYEYYQISLTAAYLDTALPYSDITTIYNKAFYHTNYRLIFGKGSIITSDKVQANENSKDTRLPSDMEKKLVRVLKSGDSKQIEQELSMMMSFISKMQYEHIIYSIRYVMLLIHQIISEINSNRIYGIYVDMKSYNSRIESCETLREVEYLFKNIMMEICEKQKHASEDKYGILIDTICSIIEENYKNVNLGLQWIASTIKLSSAHVGKVFKNSKQMSVAEYINEVRLKHALELLENEEYSVNRTFETVGFVSQSYFFTLFKKRYGCTPMEYRMATAMRTKFDEQ